MEKINIKRAFASAEFAGADEGDELINGHRYYISIAYLLDSGRVQVHLQDTMDFVSFINYADQDTFEKEWKNLQKISRKKYFEMI